MSEVTSESQATVPSGIATTPEEDLKPEGGPMSQVHVAQILEMVVTPTVELIAPEHQILPIDDHPELNLDMHMSLQDVPDSRNEEPTKSCHQESVTDAISDTCESVTKIPLNGDIVDGCKPLCQSDIVSSENTEGNTLRNVCLSTRGEGSSTASISGTLGREEKLLVSCDTLRCASGLECCNMLAARATGLETLNLVDEASNQSKGWPSVTTACCLEQQLHSTEGESTEVDKLVDFHCLESDADILGELQDDHWLDPFSVPTNPKDAYVTSLTHAMIAWDVTDPVVKTPSGEPVPNQGEIGEYVGDGEFKKKDGTDDIHTMEEFGSCENQGNQFEQKLLGSQVDFPLVTSSMKPQSEEVARISQVVGTKIAWEVDITELIGKKGRGKRPRKNVTADCGRLDHKTADLRKGRPLGQECQISSRAVIERKMLDLRRWYCISRPQYKTSCGISSVVSCWNFLFSSLGVGIHQPITQEEALTLLGFQQPYGDIKFGPFTGNNTLLMWFRAINRYHGVRGRGFYLYKPHGKNRTAGMTSQDALAQLKKGLAGTDVAYVYHCLNHYFCPIGFEDTPRNAESAYQEDTDSEEIDTWILIGDTSRKHPSMHCKRWEDISADLNNQNPDFLDVRRLWCGPQQRQSKKKGGNLHCIMGFQRCGPPRYKTRKHKKAESTSTCAPAERDCIPDTDPAIQPLSRPKPVREVKSFSGINHGATFKDDARNIARSRGKHSRSCDAF